MSSRYAAVSKQYLVFRTLLMCLIDGSCRSSSIYGFLELPSNNTMSCVNLFSNAHPRILQNVSGRTLVGLRFWNQAGPFIFISVMCFV